MQPNSYCFEKIFTKRINKMNRKEMLEATSQCVLKDRQSMHGKPEDTFSLIAKFWSDYLGIEIKDYEVGILMGLMKIARMKHNPGNDDNFVDASGYMACSCEIATKDNKAQEADSEELCRTIHTRQKSFLCYLKKGHPGHHSYAHEHSQDFK